MQEGQLLSTAVYEALSDLRQEVQEKPSEEGEDRDPSPDLEARTRFLELYGRWHFSKNVTPRTKLHAPKDDFPMPLNYHLVFQGQTKTSLDVLQEVTIDDYWNMDGGEPLSEPWIGLTRFALLNKNPPEGHMWVQGRLARKQGDIETRTHLARRVVKYVKRFTA